jgi:hypothetical protein
VIATMQCVQCGRTFKYVPPPLAEQLIRKRPVRFQCDIYLPGLYGPGTCRYDRCQGLACWRDHFLGRMLEAHDEKTGFTWRSQ